MSNWKLWLEHPQKVGIRRVSFNVHYWLGMIAALYMFVMSASGSLIVFRNQLTPAIGIEWFVDLHANLLLGNTGRWVNGIGATAMILLCLTGAIIWWPGIRQWRRALNVKWDARIGRVNWDLHSALGFWTFFFLIVWGVSGFYFCFPDYVNVLYRLDPGGEIVRGALSWLTDLHFGRFNGVTRVVWAIVGVVPAVLAFTGFFVCCRRVIFRKNDRPN